jgi:transcriptional regulator GlxA family with amidase domain
MFPKHYDAPPLKVAILALPETAPMAVYGLHEVLGSVGRIWPLVTGETLRVRFIAPQIVARNAKLYMTSAGTPIVPHAAISEVEAPDVVIVCDIELPLANGPEGLWDAEIAWIREQLARGATLCSTCSGSVVLAEGGLLDGMEAASHWSAAELFRDRYDKVRFRPDRILCESGHEGRLITTGGASAWHDLALYLIGRYCGPAEAVRVSKIFLIGDRSDGQLPFAAMTRPRQHADGVIANCQAWIAANYEVANPVTRMVEQSGLAERTFKRRFKQATGYAPVDYVQAIRIEEAKQILETTAMPIDSVAAEVGYEDPTFFRRLFKRVAGVSPARYRQRFQARTQSR